MPKNILSIEAYESTSLLINKNFVEYFDLEILQKMSNPIVQEELNMCSGNRALVYKILERQKKDNKIIVTYNPPKYKFGRIFATGGVSLLFFRRDFKHVLTKDIYIDIDIDNCHPNLILFIMRNNNFKCFRYLEDYCKNRDKRLQDVIDYYFSNNIDKVKARGMVKNLFIRLLYLGGVNSWIEDYEIDNKIIMPYIKHFMDELKEIAQIIFDNNQKLHKKILLNKGYTGNKYSTIMAYYLQNLERLILEEIYQYLEKNNIIKENSVILCYDGLMIEKKYFYDGLLVDLSNHIYDIAGIRLILSIKTMTEGDYILKILPP
jgi:hypothetical protein